MLRDSSEGGTDSLSALKIAKLREGRPDPCIRYASLIGPLGTATSSLLRPADGGEEPQHLGTLDSCVHCIEILPTSVSIPMRSIAYYITVHEPFPCCSSRSFSSRIAFRASALVDPNTYSKALSCVTSDPLLNK